MKIPPSDCPECGYKQSVSIEKKNGRDLVYCHACASPTVFDAVVKNKINSQFVAKAAITAKVRSSAYPIALWEKRHLPQGTPVEGYLQSRRYMGPIPKDIAYLPQHKHAETGLFYPVMVSAVSDVAGQVRAIHRVYLTKEGRKAQISPVKMSLGPLRGNAVQLAPAGDVLAITEGIETGLAVLQATGLPVWAALSTSGMVSIEIPSDVKEVVLMADHDAPGLKAARDAAIRLTAKGHQVKVVWPPTQGHDFEDMTGDNL